MTLITQEQINTYNDENGTELTTADANGKVVNDVLAAMSSLTEQVDDVVGKFLYQLNTDYQYESDGLLDLNEFKKQVRLAYLSGVDGLVRKQIALENQ